MHVPSLAALALLSVPLLGAQTPAGAKKATPGAGGPAGHPVSIPVTGLTAENAEPLKAALEAISISAYVCPKCHQAAPNAGACQACDTVRIEHHAPLVKDATPDVAAHAIAIAPTGLRPLPLSDISRALDTKGARVDQATLTVPGPALLVISGGKGEEDAQAVVQALDGAKLYEKVRAGFDEESGEIRVRVAGEARAPRRSAIEQALAKVPGAMRLTDVAWGLSGKPGAGPGMAGGKKSSGPQGKGKKGGKGKKNDDGDGRR